VTVKPAKILKSHKRRCIDISASSPGGLLNGGSDSQRKISGSILAYRTRETSTET
jgi:hypothetical protein